MSLPATPGDPAAAPPAPAAAAPPAPAALSFARDLRRHLPALRRSAKAHAASAAQLVALLRQWAALEAKMAAALQKLGSGSLGTLEHGSLAAGVTLFRSNLLDKGVQAKEFAATLLDDIVDAVASGTQAIHERQRGLLGGLDKAKQHYERAYNAMQKSRRRCLKLVADCERQRAALSPPPQPPSSSSSSPPQADDTPGGDRDRDSPPRDSPPSPRTTRRRGSWRGSRGSSSSSSLGSGWLGRMRSGSTNVERATARLQHLEQDAREAHAACVRESAALETLRNETRALLDERLEALEATWAARCELLGENMRKVCIYLSSRYANGQYDVQMMSNTLEVIDKDGDIQTFIRGVLQKDDGNEQASSTTAAAAASAAAVANEEEQQEQQEQQKQPQQEAGPAGQRGEGADSRDRAVGGTVSAKENSKQPSVALSDAACTLLLDGYDIPDLPALPAELQSVPGPQTPPPENKKCGVPPPPPPGAAGVFVGNFHSFVGSSDARLLPLEQRLVQEVQRLSGSSGSSTATDRPEGDGDDGNDQGDGGDGGAGDDRDEEDDGDEGDNAGNAEEDALDQNGDQRPILKEMETLLAGQDGARAVNQVLDIFHEIRKASGSSLSRPAFNLVRSLAWVTLSAMGGDGPARRSTFKLGKLLTQLGALELQQSGSSSGVEGDRSLLLEVRSHPSLCDFGFWDRALNESVRESRRVMGFNDSMDIATQEVNVTMGALIPFAHHMRSCGWSKERVRSLLRIYTLTLPAHKEHWATILAFLDNGGRKGGRPAAQPPGMDMWRTHPECACEGWVLRSFTLHGDTKFGVDVIDHATHQFETEETQKMRTGGARDLYTVTALQVREGGAFHAAGVPPGGVIVSIEGEHMRGTSFIEVVHNLKEAAILRPFAVTLAFEQERTTNANGGGGGGGGGGSGGRGDSGGDSGGGSGGGSGEEGTDEK